MTTVLDIPDEAVFGDPDWWGRTQSDPLWGIYRSGFFDAMTFAEPERWLQLEAFMAVRWIEVVIHRLSFYVDGWMHLSLRAFQADCLERVLPLYEAVFPQNTATIREQFRLLRAISDPNCSSLDRTAYKDSFRTRTLLLQQAHGTYEVTRSKQGQPSPPHVAAYYVALANDVSTQDPLEYCREARRFEPNAWGQGFPIRLDEAVWQWRRLLTYVPLEET